MVPSRPPSVSLEPGTRLGDRYRVEAVIGQGGMGIVIAAFDERLERTVAIKLLDPNRSASPLKRHRFLREARVAEMLASEHVVRVHDAGVFDDAGAYIAMERLEGTDLRKALQERQRFSASEAVEILVQACHAVAVAHGGGIIHRDLKPSNLFLEHTPEGLRVKVLDFGISKFATDEDSHSSLTDTGSAVGSPRYMSPEQVRDAKRVGPASDIWALGVVLYEMLAGTTPFVADTAPGVYAQIIADSPRPLRELRADIPASLEAVCARCLKKRPEDRYPDVATFAHALASFATAPTVGDEVSVTEMTLDPVDTKRVGVEPNRPPRARRVAVLAAAVALVALWAFLARPRSSPVTLATLTGVPSGDGPVAPPAIVPAAPIAEAPASTARPPLMAALSARVNRLPLDGGAAAVTTSGSASPPTVRCDPPFIIDPLTGTRRVKPGC